jgi:hypothetical protein
MEVVALSSLNYIGLSSTYVGDATFKINQNIIYTEDGLEIPHVNAYENLNDNVINNFSNLFLTDTKLLSSTFYIQDLEPIDDPGFCTYLITNAIGNITDNARYLVVQEPSIEVNTAICTFTGTSELFDNRYMFEIVFLTDKLCKITHENENITRYLTVDYLGNLVFAKDAQADYLKDLSPQIFYYTYSRTSQYISFCTNVNDIVKVLAYSPVTNNFTLNDFITGADVPFTPRSIFRCLPRPTTPDTAYLYDPWVSYNKDLKTNSQNISRQNSFQDVNSNLLINNEFYSVTGSEMHVNVLSLKNTNTPENFQSRNSPFQSSKSALLTGSPIENRNYKRLFTGSNQKHGNDNITLGYESYTTDIVLPADNITYFHIPYNFYPFVQININDSGLIEAGSIAGDHPLKSDKVFKKLVNAEYTSPFGTVTDEADGYFLCSWLSGNWDTNTKPVWMDRYYNPSKVSFFNALTSNPFQAITYTTQSECLFASVENILGKVDVFDKPSDLVFEPSAYYAYHHYGKSSVDKYINSLSIYSIANNFKLYNNSDFTPVIISNYVPAGSAYEFDGNRYAITESLSAIQDDGQFTLSFWGSNDDWTIPFAEQIIGNYSSDGFGIFNQNIITPTLFVDSITGTYILNSDLKRIKTIQYDNDTVYNIIKFLQTDDYYIMFNSGNFTRYNSSDDPTKNIFDVRLQYAKAIDYTQTTLYVVCSSRQYSTTSSDQFILEINLGAMTVADITERFLERDDIVFANDQNAGWSWNQPAEVSLDTAGTIDFYNDKLYLTPGTVSRRVNDTIYYLKDGNTIAQWNQLENSTVVAVTTAFKSNDSGIVDFNIDFSGNIWILDKQNNFYKFTPAREFVLSGTTTNNSFINYKIGFTADIIDGVYKQQVLLMQQGNLNIPPSPFTNFNYNIINHDIPPLNFVTQYGDTMYASLYSSLSAPGLLLNILNTEGAVLSSNTYISLTGSSFDPTNSDYLRKIVSVQYPSPCLNAKAVMTNVYNPNETYTADMVYPLSSLDPGTHHFAVRVDAYNGFNTFFIDGQKVTSVQYPPRKYQFNNFGYRPFLAGTAVYKNSIPLFNYLQKKEGLVINLTMSDVHVYNAALMDADIAMLARENMKINDIHFNVPCGRRNYLEEIERYFKATVPGSKSTYYNLNIRNSGIFNNDLQAVLAQRFIAKLNELAPVHTQLNNINWIN